MAWFSSRVFLAVGPSANALISIALLGGASAWGQTTSSPAVSARTPTYVGSKIRVNDLQRSIDFYTKIIGLKVATKIEFVKGKGEVLLTTSGRLVDNKLTLVYDTTRHDPTTPHHDAPTSSSQFVNLIFGVDNLASRIEALKAAGYAVERTFEVKPPFPAEPPYPPSITSVSLAFTTDPDGIGVELTQWNYSGPQP